MSKWPSTEGCYQDVYLDTFYNVAMNPKVLESAARWQKCFSFFKPNHTLCRRKVYVQMPAYKSLDGEANLCTW